MTLREQFKESTGVDVEETGALDHDYTLWLESLLSQHKEIEWKENNIAFCGNIDIGFVDKTLRTIT